MKKLIFLLSILISTIFINGTIGVADSNINNSINEKILKEIYHINLIKEIESESEITIPDYVDIKYIEYMYSLSKELSLSTRMVFRLAYRESSFVDTIVSPEGAQGFMQVMPDTYELYAKALQVDTLNIDANCKNIYIGLHMLKDLYNYWIEKGEPDKYSWVLSLACYNAGIGKVLFYNGVPPYKETIKYIGFVLKEHSIATNVPLDNYLANR